MGRNNFCQEFEYSVSSEGYWTYDRMVLKLEDCTKIIKALHTGIDFIFIFDHTCGHDRGIKYRLNVMKMNIGYGGAQQEIHPTNTNKEVSYLGPHELILEVGYDNNMVFQEGSDVPFWITPLDYIATKLSHYVVGVVVDNHHQSVRFVQIMRWWSSNLRH